MYLFKAEVKCWDDLGVRIFKVPIIEVSLHGTLYMYSLTCGFSNDVPYMLNISQKL